MASASDVPSRIAAARFRLWKMCIRDRAWFEERDVAGTMAFLSDDVHFVGTGENEFAVGTKQMAVSYTHLRTM